MDSGAVARQRVHRRFDLHKLMQREFAVCISGHRPEKLPTGAALRMLQSLLFREIEIKKINIHQNPFASPNLA